MPGVPAGQYRLFGQRGRPVVLAFYPGDFSPVCTQQLTEYTRDRAQLDATGALLWGISTDDLEQHERFARARALMMPLLADVSGVVAELYGVKGLFGRRARRSLFVIDPEGVIRHRSEEPLSLTYRTVDDIVAAVEAAGVKVG